MGCFDHTQALSTFFLLALVGWTWYHSVNSDGMVRPKSGCVDCQGLLYFVT